MRIYLIGMMGSGKSTLGKRLAEVMNYEFIDMDQTIELEACMYIDEIFQAYGEEFFRALETNTLKKLSMKDNVVISTGGGVIKNKAHKEIMDGVCVYLNVPCEVLEERVKGTEEIRPILQSKSVTEVFNERKHLYEYFADVTVMNVDMDEAVKEIVEALK